MPGIGTLLKAGREISFESTRELAQPEKKESLTDQREIAGLDLSPLAALQKKLDHLSRPGGELEATLGNKEKRAQLTSDLKTAEVFLQKMVGAKFHDREVTDPLQKVHALIRTLEAARPNEFSKLARAMGKLADGLAVTIPYCEDKISSAHEKLTEGAFSGVGGSLLGQRQKNIGRSTELGSTALQSEAARKRWEYSGQAYRLVRGGGTLSTASTQPATRPTAEKETPTKTEKD